MQWWWNFIQKGGIMIFKKTKLYCKLLALCFLFQFISSCYIDEDTPDQEKVAAPQSNIALTASVSTSYVSPWETLTAVNDGVTPADSMDNADGAYGNWDGEENYNTYNYVQYNWGTIQDLASTSVYWWDDGLGIDQPTDAYIQYLDGNEWVDAGSIGTSLNQYNTLSLDVTTSGLRIYMISSMATGILEWEVYGTGAGQDDSDDGDQDDTDGDDTGGDDTDGDGTAYTWPTYNPTISYNFKDEYGDVPMPTQDLDDCSGVAGSLSSGWWTFRWGANKNPLVTEAAIRPMLERLNTDFAYFRDMGWPPDLRALNGYRSAVYLYGSGLCTDNASNTDLGGWQSAIYYNGQSWPMILASYYPVYSFDPACTYGDKVSQQGAMVHEGIHCILASLPGCKNAAWFHEGGNTWLQQEADSRRSGNYSSMGFLNAAAIIAPFMPIECYSGWLQDGSFGGPSAEGVNMYNNGTQICTWKNLLGGTQYGNLFPTFLGQALGDGSVPWIWKYCTSRVLEGMAATLGDDQIRRLICEYRAKQAVVDFGKWNNAVTALLDANMGAAIQEEWSPYNIDCPVWTATPYAVTTNNGNGLLTPAAWTTPGWSGANQIPLTVSGSSVTVNFQPIDANMTCQLCYIATDGTRVYSDIVSSGDCRLDLVKAPANNVVIAVICNTDYIYNGESTRTAHYDYRLQLGTGVTGTADVNQRWYRGANL
jgi:hypothetical protein